MSADAYAFMNDSLLTAPLLKGRYKMRRGPSAPPRDAILLTGGTGFIGTYCLGEIMRQNPDVHIFAVVRGGKKWRLASREFPQSVMGSELGEENPADFNPVYGHELPKGWSSRCTALDGDCAAGDPDNGIPMFKLSPEDLETIAQRCFAVIHLACETSYVAKYADNRRWAVAFNALCGFCMDNDIAMHYLGGTGRNVYAGVKPEEINEESLYSNGYFRLKYVQHKMINRYIDAGLQGTAYDVPYVFGAPETGGQYPGLHYEPIRILAIFAATGLRFDYGGYDTITVDVLCNLMVKNALHGERSRYFRVFDPDYVSEAMMGDELAARGYKTELCHSQEEFFAKALKKGMPKRKLDRYFYPTATDDATKIRDAARPRFVPAGFKTVPSAFVLKQSLENIKAEWEGCVMRYKKSMTKSML